MGTYDFKVSKVSKYTLFNEGDLIGGTSLPWGPLKQVNKPFINNNKQNLWQKTRYIYA